MITTNLVMLIQLLSLLLVHSNHCLAITDADANTNPSVNAPPSPPPPPADPFYPFPQGSAYFMTISHPMEDFINVPDVLATLTQCLTFYHSDAITHGATDLSLIATPSLHWNVDPVLVRGLPQIYIEAENPATKGVAYGDVWKVLDGLGIYARAWRASEDFWMPSLEFETRWVLMEDPEVIRRVKGWMSVNREESGNGGGGVVVGGDGAVGVAGNSAAVNENGTVVLNLI